MSATYRVVCGTLDAVEEQVTRLLKTGWEPVGGVAFIESPNVPDYQFYFAQAMMVSQPS